VTFKAGDPTGSGLSAREREDKAALTYRGVAAFEIELMDVWLLLPTWNRRS